MALRLIIEDEEGATTIVPLGEEEITIGREPGNTIQLTEQNVSRQHARLTPGSDGWVIEDLDSYNGVRVNGVLIEGTVNLNEGDVVQIGDYHLAITNNAEQITISSDRSAAANTDPMRAAPSLDLPRIPASEAALIAPPPPIVEPPRERDEDHGGEGSSEGKGKGLLVALLLVLLVGGGFVAYQFAGGGGQPPAPKTVKNDPPAKADEPKVPETKVEPKQPDPVPEPPLPNDPVPDPVATTDPPPGDSGDAPDEPVKKPLVPKGEKKPPQPKVEKPPVPKGDPVQLLEDARKANLAGNATQAYDLAKKSYDIDKNANALALMGASACKMGDQAKAKSVFKKLTDPNRQKQMITVCAERGIMLE